MTDPIASTPATPDPRAAHRAAAARDFEAVFAGQIAKLMLEQVEIDGSFGGGHGEELFRGMMAEEVGRGIAKSGQLGLAPTVLAALQRMEKGE
ncbi:rod-binding protein [Sphingomonas sp. LHG3443-2]|uniref:rod-binding protein n=1 Tax=Sphingomonas sp. LHG3443-2 TaxID=2804639 RepID=UPI003CF23DC4